LVILIDISSGADVNIEILQGEMLISSGVNAIDRNSSGELFYVRNSSGVW
jgi:hypothetical protein